jgi:secreted trypsin-like serine protease
MVRTGNEVNRKIGLRAATLLLSGAALLASASPAAAIINGAPDGDAHPNVGLLVAVIDGRLSAVCSGTLIAPRVFLTAAHCTGYLESLGLDWAAVTFDAAAGSTSEFYFGSLYTHPLFSKSQSDPADIGVLALYTPVTDIEPARLPELGELDTMSADKGLDDQGFTAAGYGAIGWVKAQVPGGKLWYSDFVRRVSSPRFKAMNDNRLHLSQNPALGDSGTCYGDSGGPNFIGDTNVIAGTTMTGDHVCRATNVIYRLDTPTARSFLENFLTLP